MPNETEEIIETTETIEPVEAPPVPLTEITLTLNGKDYTVKKMKSMAAVIAIGILGTYARNAIPLLRSFNFSDTSADNMLKLTIELMASLGPALDEKPMEFFRLIQVISGIDQKILSEIEIGELIDVVKAIVALNNMGGLLTLAGSTVR